MSRYWPLINPFEASAAEVPLLREAFPEWKIGHGIFGALADLDTMPWSESAESDILDIEYFGNRSGGKFVAPVIMNLLGDTEQLLDSDRTILAKILWTKYKEPWTRLWETNVAAYNPIHNYDMTEERHLERDDDENETDDRSIVDSTTHGRGVEETTTHGKTVTDTITHGKEVEETTTHGKTVTDTVTHGKEVEETTTHGKTVTDTVTHGKEVEETTTHGKTNTDQKNYGRTSDQTTTENGSTDTTESVWGLNSGANPKPANTTDVTTSNTTVVALQEGGRDTETITEGGTTVVDTQEGGTTRDQSTEGGTTSVDTQESGTTRDQSTEGGTTSVDTQESGTTSESTAEGGTTREVSQESGTTRKNVTDGNERALTAGRVEDETLHRSGNIGVTTTQQMLTAERELWLWNYFDQIYKDIDSVLALPFYDPCRI